MRLNEFGKRKTIDYPEAETECAFGETAAAHAVIVAVSAWRILGAGSASGVSRLDVRQVSSLLGAVDIPCRGASEVI